MLGDRGCLPWVVMWVSWCTQAYTKAGFTGSFAFDVVDNTLTGTLVLSSGAEADKFQIVKRADYTVPVCG